MRNDMVKSSLFMILLSWRKVRMGGYAASFYGRAALITINDERLTINDERLTNND